ncbi:MAG: hypothetical protein EA424_18945 [Planctomycetaceae bacterium]|nr:MAG: hypothetical protein EA424_18945 [Planctomycetaceae bacterium]
MGRDWRFWLRWMAGGVDIEWVTPKVSRFPELVQFFGRHGIAAVFELDHGRGARFGGRPGDRRSI